jgi:HEAT repeat protein
MLLAVLSLAVSVPFAAAQGADEYKDEIRKLLKEGVDLYRQGKYKEAHSKLEEAFQKKPDSDLVYAFLKRAEEDVVASMMNAPDEQMKMDGYRLFELAKPGETIRRSKVEVLKYLEQIQSTEHAVQRNAHWHLKHFAPWDLRWIVPVLGNKLADMHRSRLILCLTEIGTEATTALIECLENRPTPGDPATESAMFMRQNACVILGNIKDDRALPYLKRTAEDPNEMPEVKKFANEALMKITRKGLDQLKPAKDYFFELAEKYYYGHSSVVHAWSRSYLVWRWDNDKKTLTEREVPRFAWNEQMAEETLYDLLKLDPNYIHAEKGTPWALLACVHYSQAIEAEAGIHAAEVALKGMEPGLKPKHVDDLKEWLAQAERHNVLASVPGKRYIYEALKRSIDDNSHLVAKAAIETIKEMGRPEDLPDVNQSGTAGQSTVGWPLVQALTSDDKRVRYAASEAMVRINPQTRKLGMELVVPNLVDAVGEQGVRVALIIYDVQDDNDRNFVNSLRKLLIKINVFPVVATSGEEGIIKAKQFPSEDVIIIQKKIAGQIYFKETETKRTQVVETVFDTLRDDVRTKYIPRLVLADGAADLEDAKKQFDQTAQGFLENGLIGQAGAHLVVAGIMDKLFDSAEAKKDSKDRADLIARSAAETFAAIDVTNTLYPFRDAVDALIKTVSPEILRENFIRIPAARALGHFGDQRAIGVCSKVLADRGANDEATKAAKGVRWACARALSDIFKVTDYSPDKDVFGILKATLTDGDYDIELTTGEACGNARLDNLQRLEYEEARRVNSRRKALTPEDD